jgi:hypothetical protein
MPLNSLLGRVESELIDKHELIVRSLFSKAMKEPPPIDSGNCEICRSLIELYKYPQLACDAGHYAVLHGLQNHMESDYIEYKLSELLDCARLIDQHQLFQNCPIFDAENELHRELLMNHIEQG